jgi:carbamoyl-phosphate synthase large subunit
MKRILVTGAGGSPAIGFCRSLRAAPEQFHLIGFDTNKYTLQRAETDEAHLVPKVSDKAYLPVVLDILKETRPDLMHIQISAEMIAISSLRDQLPCNTFLPRHETIIACEDKFASFRNWKEAGLTVPETLLLNSREDLAKAFKDFGPRLWLRFTSGSAGRGALPTSDPEEAFLWIEFHKGWGKFTAAECLEEQTITWQSIWKNGELIVAQGRKRLYWEFANRARSGVTGITGTGVTVSDPVVDEIAVAAIKAIDNEPNGVFGVDLTYDRRGVPNPTEINIGRFFTTHQFFTSAGLNMPYIFVQCGLNGEVPPIGRKINPLTPGLAWVRGMDVLPVLTTTAQIEARATELVERRAKVDMVDAERGVATQVKGNS